jgi:hypothetical protein
MEPAAENTAADCNGGDTGSPCCNGFPCIINSGCIYTETVSVDASGSVLDTLTYNFATTESQAINI